MYMFLPLQCHRASLSGTIRPEPLVISGASGVVMDAGSAVKVVMQPDGSVLLQPASKEDRCAKPEGTAALSSFYCRKIIRKLLRFT